jgi:hypothetical protein
MGRSISIVEYKVQQAHFFLERLDVSELNFFAVQCFTDAFASACRSITFSMQAVMNDVPGFKDWYLPRMESLKRDRVFAFFNSYRTASIHIGDTVVRSGASFRGEDGKRCRQYFFMAIPEVPCVPGEDVVTICRSHCKNLLSLVYDAFSTFLCQLDDRWYFTEDNFRRMGRSFDDAIIELGFPREWALAAAGSGLDDEGKWRVLRSTQTVGCQLNQLFDRYLGKTIQGPDDRKEQNEHSLPDNTQGNNLA